MFSSGKPNGSSAPWKCVTTLYFPLSHILFFIPVVNTLYNLVQYCSWGGTVAEVLGLHTILSLVGGVLLAISMFKQNGKLFIIGAALNALSFLPWIFDNLGYSYLITFTISYIAEAVSWLLVIFVLLKRDKAKNFYIIAIVLCVLSDVITMNDVGLSEIFNCLISLLCFSVPVVLSSFVLENADIGLESIQIHTAGATPSPNRLNQYDKLTKLKDLLDVGAITQEEFDQKKKELLNQ